MLHDRAQRLHVAIYMKGEEGLCAENGSVITDQNKLPCYKPRLLTLLETASRPWNGLIVSRPACECCGSLIPGAVGWRRGGRPRATKAFCFSLGVGLPAPLSAVGSDFTHIMCMHTHAGPRAKMTLKHAQTHTAGPGVWGVKSVHVVRRGTNEVCLSSIQSTTTGQKQPHNLSPGWQILIVLRRKWHRQAAGRCFPAK